MDVKSFRPQELKKDDGLKIKAVSAYDINKAKKSCRKCHGTGLEGRKDETTFVICRCVIKRMKKEKANG